MAATSSLKNMVLCLSLVCLVCSAVVGGAYALTKDPIDEAARAKTTASIARVLPEFSAEPVQGSITVDGVPYTYYKVDGAGCAVAGEDCHTRLPGVFVAGDIRTKELRQLVTAAADGAVAATEAVKYLNG